MTLVLCVLSSKKGLVVYLSVVSFSDVFARSVLLFPLTFFFSLQEKVFRTKVDVDRFSLRYAPLFPPLSSCYFCPFPASACDSVRDDLIGLAPT